MKSLTSGAQVEGSKLWPWRHRAERELFSPFDPFPFLYRCSVCKRLFLTNWSKTAFVRHNEVVCEDMQRQGAKP